MSSIQDLTAKVEKFEKAGGVSDSDRETLFDEHSEIVSQLEALTESLTGVEDKPHPPELVGVPSAGSPTGEPVTIVSYEYRDIWAEESGAIKSDSAQWSFGNGATGFLGLPVMGEGWEIFEMYFHADTYPSTAQIEVAVCDYLIAASSAAANVLGTIKLSDARDGFGDTNNAAKVVVFEDPLPVNEKAIIGFRTLEAKGSMSDARVGVRLRRKN